MSKKIRYQEQDEDDIVIANMNVEGMPWYREDKSAKPNASDMSRHPEKKAANPYAAEEPEPLDRRQTFYVIWGALKAGLLIVGVFAIGLILFVLFCTKIWL